MQFNRTIAATFSVLLAVGVSSASAQQNQPNNPYRLAAYAVPIEVTFGKLTGDTRFSGRAAVIENSGKRFLELNLKKVAHGKFEAKLVKKESLSTGAFPTDAPSVDLGTPATGTKDVAISKEIDVWLYRTVAIIDKSSGRVVAYTNLRSAQEIGKS